MNEILVPLAPVDLIEHLILFKLRAKTEPETDILRRRDMLQRTFDRVLSTNDSLNGLCANFEEVCEDLLSLETDLATCETKSDFGPGFVALTRSYLATLKQRDKIKAEISAVLHKQRSTTKGEIPNST